MIKKILKYVLWGLLAIVAYFFAYFLLTVILTLIPANTDFQPAEDGVDLYIISNGVHTDICFSVVDAEMNWQEILDFDRFLTPIDSLQYLSVGWGDKGFYFDTPTWADLTVRTALRAAFLPTPTAIHVSALSTTPTLGERIKKVTIDRDQLRAIERYIRDSFQLKSGKAQLIDCCRYEGYDDNFYEAKGAYHMWRTCNSWANQTLKAGGVKTATWAPFDRCILYHF